MENILTKDEHILFNDENGLIVTNKKIVVAESDELDKTKKYYHCYPLFSIIKLVIMSFESHQELSIELKNIKFVIKSDACDKISEIHECILNAW